MGLITHFYYSLVPLFQQNSIEFDLSHIIMFVSFAYDNIIEYFACYFVICNLSLVIVTFNISCGTIFDI